MKLKVLLSILVPFAFVSAIAQPSASYYQSINGYKESGLKSQLNTILSNHTKLSYDKLWTYYEKVDYLPKTDASGQHLIMDYYSESLHYFTGNGDDPSNMNKEHVAPQSWWGGGTNNGVGSDLFQVLPSEAQANSNKSNFQLGVVSGTPSTSNARMKTGYDKTGQMVFEPCDEYKGDFARIYFYVATCYPDVEWVDYNSSNNNTAFTKEDYPTLNANMTEMLLEWHQNDPVSEWEITRNNRVEKEQKNRNPFIDYPNLAFYIWGDKTTEAFDLSTQTLYKFSDETDEEFYYPAIKQEENLFVEPFSDITSGNDTDTGGSSTLWNGNSNITSVNTVYQAGGAVRLGTGSKPGSLTTRQITFDGGKLILEIDVKGWTTVEGKLNVSVNGGTTKSYSYTAKMSDDYETVHIELENVPKNPYFTISTSAKRCFITEIRVMSPKKENEEIALSHECVTYYTTCHLDFSPCGNDLKAYIASSYKDGTLYLKRVQQVPANSALILVGTANQSYTIPAMADTPEFFPNLLVGVHAETVIPQTKGSYTNFIFNEGSVSSSSFQSAEATLSADKCYLRLPTSYIGSVQTVSLSFDQQFDVNHDGSINISDVVTLVNFILGN
jgi:endonuclease I